MLRITLIVLAMLIVSQSHAWGDAALYKDALTAGLLVLLMKPWLLDQFE